jgi:hypothetical protein
MRRTLSICLLLAAAPAFAQESTFHAELRREGEDIKKDCSAFDLKQIGSCAVTLATGHPFHVAFGSIAPMNGLGLGAAFIGHRAPNESWRINWSADAVAAFGGAWRAGAYLTFVNTNVPPIIVVTDPTAVGSAGGAIRPYPAYRAYVQRISLPTLAFYGIGPSTTQAGESFFGLSETVTGGDVIVPIARAGRLNLSLLGELNGRFVAVRSGDPADGPSIETLYSNASAPGLSTQPGFVQFGEGARVTPSLAGGRVALDYAVRFQQFVAPSDDTYSFRRWTIDLQHEIPLYRSARLQGPSAINTPNSCAMSPSIDRCPPISRNRTGSIALRAFLSRSDVGNGSRVPFYFQQTLGGSDINGERRLASYDDYRFRGPHVLLFQESLEHSLGTWPVGVFVGAEQGRVTDLDEGGGKMRYSVAAGLTLRAGGFPVVVLSFAKEGSEGGHVAFTIDTSLLGGAPRPSLH